jgi:translocation and assembly module TamB
MRFVLWLLGVVVVVPGIVVAAAFITLNTGAGRAFAVREINKYAGPDIHVSGLAGHFPADIKLAHVTVADRDGIWLTGDNLELRWTPAQLRDRKIHVTALTAQKISVARAPVAGQAQSQGNGFTPPEFRLDVDMISIAALDLGPALAGQATQLAINGSTHLDDFETGRAVLDASAADGRGNYQIDAAINPQTINTSLHVLEPPDGLLGHFAGRRVHEPLSIRLTLAGPRGNAALNFNASLGAAELDGAGTIGLDPALPRVDVVLTVPALAPFAAMAGQQIDGATKLHLQVLRQGGGAAVSLDGAVALTRAPGPAAKLVGPNGQLSLRLRLVNDMAEIQHLAVTGAGFEMGASGTITASGLDLNTHLRLTDVSDISPGLAGNVSADGGISGSFRDFAVNARLSGEILEKRVPSGPFSIAINAQHLPGTPSGTLTGAGALEGYPLLLDAQFSSDSDGAAHVIINKALWRSLNAKANLALAAGATLPTGTATFAVGNLGDFRAFLPVPLAGGVYGDFSHRNAQDFALDVTARNLVAAPSLGAIDATVNANGPVNALAVKLSATIAKLITAPARIAAAGVLNLDARSATIATLAASWRGVDAKLLAPASVELAGVKIHHLALGLNGGRINLDGAISPRLDATMGVSALPASLADVFAPGAKATGTLDASARLTGTPASPAGTITLAAHDIRLRAGPAAALPAASLDAVARLAGHSARVNARLGLGPAATLAADGLLPLGAGGGLSLHLTGTTDLRLLDPILAAGGTSVRGTLTPDLTITGTKAAPLAQGSVALAGGSVENIGSGLNLTRISATLTAAGRQLALRDFTAAAGQGEITGTGTADLGQPQIPFDLSIAAKGATPVASDLVTARLDAALRLSGALRGAMRLAGTVEILAANINIPKTLPPAVADLPIVNAGAPPPPPAPPAPPALALALAVHAKNQIFIRGDGLFAELGGRLKVTGTAAAPDPEGGFTLLRGNFALGGKTLQFTSGVVSFNGAGMIPTLDLEATTTTIANASATLKVGGTAAAPTITLSAVPPLPGDEVLSQLLFGQAAASLSPFQAASLAAALASLSGVGGGAMSDPLGGVRSALGLDELSLGGGGSGAPTVNAGRYVAPGVYVGARQSTTGQGTQASVQINLYKGLQLQTATGSAGSGAGASSSVGLTYQFNY